MSQHLLKDLKDLVRANIISEETAKQIEVFYENKKGPSSNRFAAVMGILGALLVGFGVALVVAHNWDDLGRTAQTLCAFIPMLLAQALSLYSLVRKEGNRVWKESSAALLFFTVAASISLTSQIYQINGSLSSFLLTWIALCLPLVYIMSSAVVSLLIIALATWYACLVGYAEIFSGKINPPYLYLAVLLLLVPFYYRNLKLSHPGNGFHLHNWFFALSAAIVLGTFFEKNDDYSEWVFIGYMALAGVFHLLGNSPLFKKESLFANPYRLLGTLGIIIMFLCWSFNWLWEPPAHNGYGFSITAILLLALCAYLYVRQQRKLVFSDWDLMGISPFLFTLALLLLRGNIAMGLLIMNAWILILAVHFIRKGTASNHLGILNFGLLIIASLAIIRFFDDSIPFVWRGLIFLTAGAGFFIANYILLKKRRSIAKNSGV